jgi:hypothetical protein
MELLGENYSMIKEKCFQIKEVQAWMKKEVIKASI